MITAIIAAAGSGKRAGLAVNKILQKLCGKEVLCYSLELFYRIEQVSEIIIVSSERDCLEIDRLCKKALVDKPYKVVIGGAERQDSIFNALKQVSEKSEYVLVHDGARPLVTEAAILHLIGEMKEKKAVVPGVPVKDTIKYIEDGRVTDTPERSKLYSIQTPQGFCVELLKKAYHRAFAERYYGTDDSSLAEHDGAQVFVVNGEYENIKITTPEDFRIAAEIISGRSGRRDMNYTRTGFGYDVHRLVEGRKLVLGGVDLVFERGLLGHSDADVLLHAVKDALLGAAGLGDIGRHFPDSDGKYKGISSLLLLGRVCNMLTGNKYEIVNIDATIVAEKPKVAKYIPDMVCNIAKACGIEAARVNVKATTTEGLGFAGREEGIASYAVATIAKRE